MSDATASAQIAEQKAANRSAIEHFDSFEEHRRRLTSTLVARATGDAPRLCVLGAGNCYDLDLAALARVYAEVHLVDLDRDAVEQARLREAPAIRGRLIAHGPLDLTGAFDRLDAWKRLQTTAAEITAWPGNTARSIAEALPGPFDVVASTCLLSQLHFAFLNVLSDTHRLFAVLRQLLNVAHLRTLAALTAAGGHGVLINDLASREMIDGSGVPAALPPLELALELARRGQVIYAVQPDLLRWCLSEDPVLSRSASLDPPSDAWFWRVGPDSSFLVCVQLLQLRT